MESQVSVIIPNHNYARYIEKTIDSVLGQTHSNLEIIVVDNGSTDHSIEILNSYGRRIRTILQENLGQAVARNRGLKVANGEYIALLDADDYWEPDKIEKQLALISSDSQLIYSGIRQFDSTTGKTLRFFSPAFSGDCKKAFLENPNRAVVLGGESTALFTRRLSAIVGDFNTSLNSASGRDFYRRCSKHTNFLFVDEPLVNYRSHNNNLSANSRHVMNDTLKAYEILFEDPEWLFAKNFQKNCMLQLYRSFIKTSLRNFDLIGAFRDYRRMLNL